MLPGKAICRLYVAREGYMLPGEVNMLSGKSTVVCQVIGMLLTALSI